MTDTEVITAGIEYAKKFTPVQIDEMQKRISQRILAKKKFMFGPESRGKILVHFKKYLNLILLVADNGIELNAWGNKTPVNEICNDLFQMLACWDIVMKNYVIAQARNMGYEM